MEGLGAMRGIMDGKRGLIEELLAWQRARDEAVQLVEEISEGTARGEEAPEILPEKSEKDPLRTLTEDKRQFPGGNFSLGADLGPNEVILEDVWVVFEEHKGCAGVEENKSSLGMRRMDFEDF